MDVRVCYKVRTRRVSFTFYGLRSRKLKGSSQDVRVDVDMVGEDREQFPDRKEGGRVRDRGRKLWKKRP